MHLYLEPQVKHALQNQCKMKMRMHTFTPTLFLPWKCSIPEVFLIFSWPEVCFCSALMAKMLMRDWSCGKANQTKIGQGRFVDSEFIFFLALYVVASLCVGAFLLFFTDMN
jgi:hypothetical protein